MFTSSSPFIGSPPKDIPLSRPPLIRVLTQIRFPTIASIESQGFIAPFQEAIRNDFPEVQAEQSSSLSVGPNGLSVQPQTIWRFSTFDKSATISLGSGFVSLEVMEYKGKDRFLALFKPVLAKVESVFKPARAERIGLRYVNRFKGEELMRLREFVRPEILGIFSSDVSQDLKHSVSEAVLDVEGNNTRLLARWGLLDSGLTHDPAAMPASAERIWFLDIDAYSDRAEPFETNTLSEQLSTFADADYRFFRWVTSESCLQYFGGAL